MITQFYLFESSIDIPDLICILSLNKTIQEYKKELCRLEMLSQVVSLDSEDSVIKTMNKCILDKISIRKNND